MKFGGFQMFESYVLSVHFHFISSKVGIKLEASIIPKAKTNVQNIRVKHTVNDFSR